MYDRRSTTLATMDVSAWDQVLDRVDHVVAGHLGTTEALEADVAALLAQAMADGYVDRELDPLDSARWLVRLLQVEAEVHSGDDATLSTVRVIITRWLHPGRLDV